jgi:tRNA nucleotidyltransferase (CCA-adding enzyme)
MIKIYHVGGSVRDELMGIPREDIKDLDFAVEAPSFAAMREHILSLGGNIFQEREIFLTIRAKVPELGAADYVLCRKDGFYSDARRPDSVSVGTLFDDLARRDFTVNAIAKDLAGNLIDPHGGIEDVHRRVLRCVGIAEERFREDALRLIRAMRFTITKGFDLDEDIERCLDDSNLLNLLDKLPDERIREELVRCFAFSTTDALEFLERFYMLRRKLFTSKALWLKPTMEQC